MTIRHVYTSWFTRVLINTVCDTGHQPFLPRRSEGPTMICSLWLHSVRPFSLALRVEQSSYLQERSVTALNAIYRIMNVRLENELVLNLTIELGYANTKIYKCENEVCPRPDSYR
ncbi:hypothetical protein EV424DRAFT_1137581 [Suillus variegatus]|nr:hypothetical protein EV424DRAFT_1137581 [Suillus variegatus]